jgi:hypothetical protein
LGSGKEKESVMASKVCEQLIRFSKEFDELEQSKYGRRFQKVAVHTMFLFAKFYRHFANALPSKIEIEEVAGLNISKRITAAGYAAVKAFWETEVKDLPEVPVKVVKGAQEISRQAHKRLSEIAGQFERLAEKAKAKQEKKAA